MNLCKISEKLSEHYNIPCKIIGFDSGHGMPHALDYRDHPEKYHYGDFKPHDKNLLIDSLPINAKIYYGDIDDTIDKFVKDMY